MMWTSGVDRRVDPYAAQRYERERELFTAGAARPPPPPSHYYGSRDVVVKRYDVEDPYSTTQATDEMECCAVTSLISLFIFFLIIIIWSASYGITDDYYGNQAGEGSSWWCTQYCNGARPCPSRCLRG